MSPISLPKGESLKAALLQGLARLPAVLKSIKSVFSILVQRIRLFLTNNRQFFIELRYVFKGGFSPDHPTRRVYLLFIISFVGAIGLTSYVVGQTIRAKAHAKRERREKAKQLLEATERIQQDLDRRRETMVYLGKFPLQISGDVPFKRHGRGPLNLAEVEVILYCDNSETQAFLIENLLYVKNQVSLMLTAVSREEIMTKKGKARLLLRIAAQVNQWLPHGKVEEVFFSRFAIG